MPGTDGIALAKKLRQMGDSVSIIFVTGNPDFALEGYDLEAVSYILKPVKRQRLWAALSRARERVAHRKSIIVALFGGEVEKVYQVDLFGPVAGAAARLEALRDLDGEPIRPARAAVLRQAGQRAVMEITIHEGKNRQVRRMCGACGLTVKRLRRVREHTLELGDLPAGQWRYLTTEETAALRGVL